MDPRRRRYLYKRCPVGPVLMSSRTRPNEKPTPTCSVHAAVADSAVLTAFRATTGPAAEGSIDGADCQKVDLIVICSHGRSEIEQLLFGSVAEKVLHGANCVTLVTQGQEVSK